MVDALRGLDFLPGFTLQVNNRKLIQGFYAGLGAPDLPAVMRAVDKLDKLSAEDVRTPARRRGRASTPEQADQCLALAQISAEDTSFVEQVRALGVRHELLEEGLTELAAVVEGCLPLASDRVRVVADLRIARGLDYYTGTVFETRLARLRGTRLDLLRRPVRRAGQRRPYDVPRASASPSGSAACSSRWSTAACSTPTARCPAPCWWPCRRGEPRGQRRRWPTSCAPTASPARWRRRRRSSASRSGIAERRGIPYVLFPGGRRRPRGQGHPQRRPVAGRPRHLDPARRGPATTRPAQRLSRPTRTHPTRRKHPDVIRTHDAGTPHRRGRRHRRHPRRLGGPTARPRGSGLHRPARRQRRRAGRHPRRGRRAPPAQRVLPQGHRHRLRCAPRATRTTQLPDRRRSR